VSDAVALEWLDKLLALTDAQRIEPLQRLSENSPELHARLVQLLAAALKPDGSQVLARPVLAGLGAVHVNAMPSPEAGQCVAEYRLIRELGRGGMSSVWLADRPDGRIKREIALKLPLLALSSASDAERFAREKDVLASLTHPNIARLYDAGIASNQPYIALEYVDGVAITEYCDQRVLDIAERLALFQQVLGAVDHAHKHLVVHRDLKPSNILVDGNGQVKLLDFGIAKLMTAPSGAAAAVMLTQVGKAVMTPLYAAPEQVSAEPISTLTDLYVLGIVLHELLTGLQPRADPDAPPRSLAQVVQGLMREDAVYPSHAASKESHARARAFPNPRALRKALSGDLDSIVHKLLQKSPERRYGSVQQLADDIECFLGCRPISARPREFRYAARLFFNRNRSACIAGLLGAALTLAAGATAFLQYREASAHEARTTAVREFMFDLVDDAEPDENQGDAKVTGKQMLDGAVRRARRDFPTQPLLQGELLGELGRMYDRLQEHDDAKRILVEAVDLLEENAAPDDPALNKARAHLASVLLDEGEIDRARDLAQEALSACARDSIDCAKARAYGHAVLGRVELSAGDSAKSVRAIRDSLKETEFAFGADHVETAIAALSLAVAERNAGQLQEAGAAMARALAISAGKTMRSADRIELMRTAAVLDLDLGRYEAARVRLEALVSQTRIRDEKALQYRLLANVFLEEGEPEAALRAADAALSLAGSQTDPQTFYMHQARARALALLGKFDAAIQEIDLVRAGLAGIGQAETAPSMLRARRIKAEILLRAGRAQDAREELEASIKLLSGPAAGQFLEFGQTLDLLGCAQRELNAADAATALHARAREQLTKQLPPDHPFVSRNTLYGELSKNHREEFKRASVLYQQKLPPASSWRRLIEVQITGERCPVISADCVFVL
jgi:serine/threonine-protein kinase